MFIHLLFVVLLRIVGFLLPLSYVEQMQHIVFANLLKHWKFFVFTNLFISSIIDRIQHKLGT